MLSDNHLHDLFTLCGFASLEGNADSAVGAMMLACWLLVLEG